MYTFNLKDGFAEAILRGYRQALLTTEDYRRLCLCKKLEDLRSVLEDTDYGMFLQEEPFPLCVTSIASKCRQKMADEFFHLKSIANKPLSKFLDFVVMEKIIDNVVNLIQGAANKKSCEELMAHIDPLGWCSEMRTIASIDTQKDYQELYRIILVDSPVGMYLERYFQSQDSSDNGVSSQKLGSLLTDQDLGGTTFEIMGHILMREADFRVLSVTLNTLNTSLGTSVGLQNRNALYPSFGYLYPAGTDRIRKAENDSSVREALEMYPKYLELYDACKDFYTLIDTSSSDIERRDTLRQRNVSKSLSKKVVNATLRPLEDFIFTEYVGMCEAAFEQQFHYGIFYAWVRLKEQEIRNIVWIADMILMNRKDQMENIIPIFKPRFST